jgi:hypothetical protein
MHALVEGRCGDCFLFGSRLFIVTITNQVCSLHQLPFFQPLALAKEGPPSSHLPVELGTTPFQTQRQAGRQTSRQTHRDRETETETHTPTPTTTHRQLNDSWAQLAYQISQNGGQSRAQVGFGPAARRGGLLRPSCGRILLGRCQICAQRRFTCGSAGGHAAKLGVSFAGHDHIDSVRPLACLIAQTDFSCQSYKAICV